MDAVEQKVYRAPTPEPTLPSPVVSDTELEDGEMETIPEEEGDQEEADTLESLQVQVNKYTELLQNNQEYIDWLHKRIAAQETQIANLKIVKETQHETIRILTQSITDLKAQAEQGTKGTSHVGQNLVGS